MRIALLCQCNSIMTITVYSPFIFPHRYRFVVDLDESKDIQNMQHMILKYVQSASTNALDYMKTFAKYEYVWLQDKQSYLNRFLNECVQKCLEDNDFPDDNMNEPNAQIELFQAQVKLYYTPVSIIFREL